MGTMRNLDFSSWASVLSTLLGLLVATCLMMGIRLLFMQTMQKRRERENRQINERLKTLMAAYKTLGGSFTGSLQVSPLHLRDIRLSRLAEQTAGMPAASDADENGDSNIDLSNIDLNSESIGGERQRRVRDAVEAALADIILLGTEQQVGLAARAAQDLVAGRPIETSELVDSLRDFIREALDLEPIASGIEIPRQGPARPGGTGGGARQGSGAAASGRGGGQGGGAGAGGLGLGMGGLGLGLQQHGQDEAPTGPGGT